MRTADLSDIDPSDIDRPDTGRPPADRRGTDMPATSIHATDTPATSIHANSMPATGTAAANTRASTPIRRPSRRSLGWLLFGTALLLGPAAPPTKAATVRSGTGFYVSATGQLLTSAHGVAGCRHVTVWPTDGDGVPATVTAVEQRLDVALLTIRPHDLPQGWAAVRGLRPAMAGEPAYSIAFGVQRTLPRAPVFTRGTVGGIGATSALPAVTVVEARMEPGSSGAPLIDATGTLLGLVIGRYSETPDRTVAVPAPALARFLARHGVAPSHDDAPPADPDALLTAMAVLVQCAPLRPRPRSAQDGDRRAAGAP